MRTYYCFSCLKASVLVVDLLVLFLGLLITGLASWLLVSEHIYLTPSSSDLSLGSYLLLSVGISVSILAFLGCCGALTTSRCLLAIFIILLILLTIGEVILAVLLHYQHLDITPLVELGVSQTVQDKYHPTNTAITLYWDNLQQGLECCGSQGPSDWADAVYNRQLEETREIGIGSSSHTLPPFSLPKSCCKTCMIQTSSNPVSTLNTIERTLNLNSTRKSILIRAAQNRLLLRSITILIISCLPVSGYLL